MRFPLSSRRLRLVLLLFMIAVCGVAPGAEARQPAATITLDNTSVATGGMITIRGSGFADYVEYLLIAVHNGGSNATAIGIGMAYPDAAGNFLWRGHLPRSGRGPLYGATLDPADDAQITRLRTGNAVLEVYQPQVFDPSTRAQASFTIADASAGPDLDAGIWTGAEQRYATWAHTDFLIAEGDSPLSWIWGPQPLAVQWEPYQEAPGGWRLVQYYDKSRMEVTNPGGNTSDPYYVTNGLLVTEMVSGRTQLGNNTFATTSPSNDVVAGDSSDENAPVYASFARLLDRRNNEGHRVTEVVNRAGTVSTDERFATYNVTVGNFVPETNHYLAAPFANFLNSRGPLYDANEGTTRQGRVFDPLFYATGYPITEPYWARVKVGGVTKDVLIQLFQRRVLTFTPSNPAAFRVEMGNDGQHYYSWRYGGQ